MIDPALLAAALPEHQISLFNNSGLNVARLCLLSMGVLSLFLVLPPKEKTWASYVFSFPPLLVILIMVSGWQDILEQGFLPSSLSFVLIFADLQLLSLVFLGHFLILKEDGNKTEPGAEVLDRSLIEHFCQVFVLLFGTFVILSPPPEIAHHHSWDGLVLLWTVILFFFSKPIIEGPPRTAANATRFDEMKQRSRIMIAVSSFAIAVMFLISSIRFGMKHWPIPVPFSVALASSLGVCISSEAAFEEAIKQPLRGPADNKRNKKRQQKDSKKRLSQKDAARLSYYSVLVALIGVLYTVLKDLAPMVVDLFHR